MNIRITRELLDDWNMRIGMGQDVNIEIPYAQAEIAKRDKRIKELEEALVGYKADQAELIAKDVKQAAEISRLKGVIVKCKGALLRRKETHSPYFEEFKALAAIKEIEHER